MWKNKIVRKNLGGVKVTYLVQGLNLDRLINTAKNTNFVIRLPFHQPKAVAKTSMGKAESTIIATTCKLFSVLLALRTLIIRHIIKVTTTQISEIAHPNQVSKKRTSPRKEREMQQIIDKADAETATKATFLIRSFSRVAASIVLKSI